VRHSHFGPRTHAEPAAGRTSARGRIDSSRSLPLHTWSLAAASFRVRPFARLMRAAGWARIIFHAGNGGSWESLDADHHSTLIIMIGPRTPESSGSGGQVGGLSVTAAENKDRITVYYVANASPSPPGVDVGTRATIAAVMK
jgi:hypothetical protein